MVGILKGVDNGKFSLKIKTMKELKGKEFMKSTKELKLFKQTLTSISRRPSRFGNKIERKFEGCLQFSLYYIIYADIDNNGNT